MAGNEFILQVKSTLEYLAVQIAASLPGTVDQFELDDTVNTAAKMESASPAIVWQLMMLDPDPMDPLYRVVFGIGAKTVADVGNAVMMQLVSAVHTQLPVGAQIDVMDYTIAVPTKTGVLLVTAPALDPQQFEAASSIRLMTINAKAIKLA